MSEPESPPTLAQAVEWRVPLWAPAVRTALERGAALLPPGSTVAEIGYGSGLMAAYMAARHGWRIVGFESRESSQALARATALRYGLSERIEPRLCAPEDTIRLVGAYDGLFIKSVLYHAPDRARQLEWLDWMPRMLRPGGVLMLIENGAGGPLQRFYRKYVARSRWSQHPLFDSWTEGELRRRFSHVSTFCHGRVLLPATTDRCFVAAVVARA